MPNVLDCLHFGKRNAVTRTQLQIKTGLNDRQIRAEIEQLRREGSPIFNSQDGEGYYLATKDDDLDMMHCILRERARRDTFAENVKHLEEARQKVLNPEGVQMQMDEAGQ